MIPVIHDEQHIPVRLNTVQVNFFFDNGSKAVNRSANILLDRIEDSSDKNFRKLVIGYLGGAVTEVELRGYFTPEENEDLDRLNNGS